jgi:serine protease inhibitor
VQHATFLHVGSTGFEAAAVTMAIVYRSMGCIEKEYVHLKFDRGYALAIVDMEATQPHILYFTTVQTASGLKDTPDLFD